MIHYAVIGHINRQQQAVDLAASLDAELFIDNLTLGATWNHLRALNWGATKTGHLAVLEDDAQPVPGFRNLAPEWTDRHPLDLISYYLGTGYPPQYQQKIVAALAQADRDERDYITLPTLIHAVAYVLPCTAIPTLPLSTRRVADYGLGQAWSKATGRPPIYTVPSIVDHADIPSVENPTRRLAARKAWRLPDVPPGH